MDPGDEKPSFVLSFNVVDRQCSWKRK